MNMKAVTYDKQNQTGESHFARHINPCSTVLAVATPV